MAFPTVAALGITNTTPSSTSHTCNYPATVSAGQGLIFLGGCDGSGDTPSMSGPTALFSGTHSSHGSMVYWAEADGTEGGGTFTVSVGSSETVVVYCLAIDGWDTGTPPEISSTDTGSDAAPNPPSITPSWPAEDNLYIVFTTWNLSAVPVTFQVAYADNRNDDEASGINGAAFATAEINGSPENPAAFGLNASQAHAAFTIAVRPTSGAIVLPDFHGANRGIMRGVARGVG